MKKNSRVIIFSAILLSAGLIFVLGGFDINRQATLLPIRPVSPTIHYSDILPGNLDDIEEAIDGFAYDGDITSTVHGGVAPQDLPSAPELFVKFYATLSAERDIDRFVILGPDHFNRSGADIVYSKASFETPFGTVVSDSKFGNELAEMTGIVAEENVFIGEHSIHAHTPFIARYFPDATVVPVLLKTGSSNVDAARFGEVLADMLDERTFVVASVDFSHYLPREQALSVDQFSADILGMADADLAGKARADSPQSLAALLAAMGGVGADRFIELAVENSSTYTDRNDYTTGYVVGFYAE